MDCPKQPVPCIHAPLGCSHVAPRDQMAQHEQDIGVHFLALSKAFVLQQQQIQDLQENLQLLVDKAKAEEKAKIEAEAKSRADAERKADEIIGILMCMSLKFFSINQF